MSESLSVEHFRNILINETNNLSKLCERWSQILEEQAPISSEATDGNYEELEEFFGAIRTTIGQAKLLMSQRFKQFNDLINHCEFNTSQLPTRLNDLSGFWEMISFQVEDVMNKFNKLEQEHNNIDYKQAAKILAGGRGA